MRDITVARGAHLTLTILRVEELTGDEAVTLPLRHDVSDVMLHYVLCGSHSQRGRPKRSATSTVTRVMYRSPV